MQVEELRKARRKRNVREEEIGKRKSSMLQVKELRKAKRKKDVSKGK
ncbi:hypothetical protein ABNG30_13895 [Bacillus thuringiensis]